MDSETYDFELGKVIEEIKSQGYGTVILQMPEGLKKHAFRVAEKIKNETAALPIIWREPCYGACDVPPTNADLIVQFGHSEVPCLTDNYQVPVLFVETKSNIDPLSVVEKALDELEQKVGLITTVQHVHKIDEIKKYLESEGKECVIGTGDKRLGYPGQVLGCNITSAESIGDRVDQFLFIGSGSFHPLAVSLGTKKDVVIADPYSGEVRDVKDLGESILRQRHGAIAKAKEGNIFEILVGTKIGQRRRSLAKRLRSLIENHGKKAFVSAADSFGPRDFDYSEADVLVQSACPRIAIDDYLMYKKPMITPIELEIVLGERSWDDYQFDQILEGDVD